MIVGLLLGFGGTKINSNLYLFRFFFLIITPQSSVINIHSICRIDFYNWI